MIKVTHGGCENSKHRPATSEVCPLPPQPQLEEGPVGAGSRLPVRSGDELPVGSHWGPRPREAARHLTPLPGPGFLPEQPWLLGRRPMLAAAAGAVGHRRPVTRPT